MAATAEGTWLQKMAAGLAKVKVGGVEIGTAPTAEALSGPIDTKTYLEVIEQIALLKDGGEGDLSVYDDDLDAVRILSYFGAKGLESPLVAVLQATRRASGPDVIVRREDREVALLVSKSVAPPDWETLKELEMAELISERRRWMYVAARPTC